MPSVDGIAKLRRPFPALSDLHPRFHQPSPCASPLAALRFAASATLRLRIRGWLRGLIANYGVPLMAVLWTAMSYSIPGKVPEGVPRRIYAPLGWESASLYHWIVVKQGPSRVGDIHCLVKI